MSSRSLDLFFKACEVDNPPLLNVSGENGPRVMKAPFAVVGHDPASDLVIDVPGLSPRHCYLQAIGSKVLCIDLGSRQGVGASDGPTVACWVDQRQVARLGREVLIRLDGGPTAPDETDLPEEDLGNDPLLANPLPRIALEFRTNAVKTRWRMRRGVALVGTDPACAVKLNGPNVSKFHCALVRTGRGLWVVDLLGAMESPRFEGIRVNGEKVRFARIDPGDVLEVGSFSVGLIYLPASPKLRAATREQSPAEEAGSGEIELLGKDRMEAEGRDVDAEIEAIRREYEDQLAEETMRHRDEVEVLRDEIDFLNDRIERLRASAAPGHRRKRRGGPDVQALSTADSWPDRTRAFTLGTARRRERPAPSGRGLESPILGAELPRMEPVAGVSC